MSWEYQGESSYFHSSYQILDVSSLLKEIGKGERIALSKLAVEFLERNRRPIRIAIDIAIWQFQTQASQGGQNPAFRTFYYRLLRILALPIYPLFVYDGPKKPLAKRNKVVSRYGTTNLHNEMSKKLLQLFRFPCHDAPGEAEAECALLQREGIVDAVMSQDVDAVMWGSTVTLRDWSQEGNRGNKTPTHVNVLRAEETKASSLLDPNGMIAVAMLSGGDYAPDGVPGFGLGLACEMARAHFGSELLEIMAKDERTGLAEWRERWQYELEINFSGYFKTKHKSVKLPRDFPDETVLRYYTHPEVSSPTGLQRVNKELEEAWKGEIDATELRAYVANTFNWQYRGGACKFIRSLAPALLAQRLLRSQTDTTITSSDAILERRMHFVSDGMPELRIAAVPADIVGLNIEEEEDNPEFVQAMEEAIPADDEAIDGPADPMEPEDEAAAENASKSSKPRKKAPWDPRLPEKMWLPETIVKLGLSSLVEAWEQKQRDMLADPKKFIANKARKINPSITATQKTRSIHAYFTTAKPTISNQPVRGSSPKKSIEEVIVNHENRSIRASSTPTKRKAKPKLTESIPALALSTNPFSLANQAKKVLHSPKDSTTKQTSTNPSTAPIHRKRRPLQKSKTLPTSFDKPILISSSPVTRAASPPPPSSRLILKPARNYDSDSDHQSSSNLLALKPPLNQNTDTHPSSSPLSPSPPPPPPVSEIFACLPLLQPLLSFRTVNIRRTPRRTRTTRTRTRKSQRSSSSSSRRRGTC